MKNVLLIAGKEMKSYFSSPIAYLLMAAFALIFGATFYTSVQYMAKMGLQSQMMGQQQPISVNDMVITPLLGFAGTITLFLVPMITMRLIAEEKRTGTIELLLTSPVNDLQIILGKWVGSHALVSVHPGHVRAQSRHGLYLGQTRLAAHARCLPGPNPARRRAARHRGMALQHHSKSDRGWRRHIFSLPLPLPLKVLLPSTTADGWLRASRTCASSPTWRTSPKD